MPSELRFSYKGYELHCYAQELQNDRFSPVFVPTLHKGPKTEEGKRDFDAEYDTMEEAVEFARKAAIAWVDTHS